MSNPPVQPEQPAGAGYPENFTPAPTKSRKKAAIIGGSITAGVLALGLSFGGGYALGSSNSSSNTESGSSQFGQMGQNGQSGGMGGYGMGGQGGMGGMGGPPGGFSGQDGQSGTGTSSNGTSNGITKS